MFDPLPLIDEGLALMVFVRSMAYLGYDVTRWLPFLGKMRGKVPPDRAPGQAKNMTVDV